jgi:hypothetical protein
MGSIPRFWEGKKHFTDLEWEKIKAATFEILKWCGRNDTVIDSREDYLVLSDQFIVLNGCDGASHEIFVLRTYPFAFAFCNIVHEPFQFVVDLVLLAISKIAPNVLEISASTCLASDLGKLNRTYSSIFDIQQK